jgi:hypothetical protein
LPTGRNERFRPFGIGYDGHPDLRRLFLEDGWQGYPLRKATRTPTCWSRPDERDGPYRRTADAADRGRQSLSTQEYFEYGAAAPDAHGSLRIILLLDGETIRKVIPAPVNARGIERCASICPPQDRPLTDRRTTCRP